MAREKCGPVPGYRKTPCERRTGREPESALFIRYRDPIKETLPGKDNILVSIIMKIRVRTKFCYQDRFVRPGMTKNEKEKDESRHPSHKRHWFPYDI
jgi:hypothetical protein